MHKIYAHAILAGCILFAPVMSVSDTCQQLEKCFSDLGSTLPTGPNNSAIINFFCQKKDQLLNCYDKFKGCPTYGTYTSLLPSKSEVTKGMNFLCSHVSEYNKVVKCTVDASTSMSEADLQKSIDCQQKFLASGNIATLSTNCTSSIVIYNSEESEDTKILFPIPEDQELSVNDLR